ncbi:primase-helicase family protein [Bradyrhizobium sp. 27S5]|uniref:primase-helicase family protein n=1 Tax=Bradyrhizobium sp. 27S5 TaxID=3139728 RepID=UPI0030D03A3D
MNDLTHAALSILRSSPASKAPRAAKEKPDAKAGDPTYDEFWAYLPDHKFIYVPTGELWPAASVDSRLPPVEIPMREKPILASKWLDQNRAVQQMVWAPGEPTVIEGRLMADGGWVHHIGARSFNLYKAPPLLLPPRPDVDASPWVRHIEYVFPDEAGHIIKWLAHRVQRPEQKINHALVLGGAQGVGKDTLLDPVTHAVGKWNCQEVSPQQVLGRFNGFLKSIILRISEARDLGEADRYAFYDHMKAYTAAPPDVLRVDEKYLREHSILNVCGVIITTNHKADGIFLPADDRRHFVAWSPRTKEDFRPDYWPAIYRWFEGGGRDAVAHYLAKLDLSAWDAKAPPPKTQAFWEIVDASRAPEDAEMADVLDKLGRPHAVTLEQIITKAPTEFRQWLGDRKSRRRVPHRLDECGYVPVRNPYAKDGLWVIKGRRVAVYACKEMVVRDQIEAATQLLPTPSPHGN